MEAEAEVKTAILTRAPILLDSLKKQFENTSVDVLNPDQAGGMEAEYEVVFVDEGKIFAIEDLSTIDDCWWEALNKDVGVGSAI